MMNDLIARLLPDPVQAQQTVERPLHRIATGKDPAVDRADAHGRH